MNNKLEFGETLLYYPIQQDIRDNNLNIMLDVAKKIINDNWDQLKDFIEWDSPETTIKRYNINDYIKLWSKCKEKHINLLHQKTNIKKESILKEYNIEELRNIFNEKYILKNMCDVIQFILYYRRKHHKKGKIFTLPEPPLYVLSMKLDVYNVYLQTHKDCDENELDEKELKEVLNAKLAIAFLFHKLLAKGTKEYNDFKPIADLLFNHIQFMSNADLKKLLDKFGRYLVDGRGKTCKNIPVYVLNKYGELVKRYNNRQECMNAEKLGKQYMQQLLNGNKRRNKCTYCEMTDEQYKEHVITLENLG